MNFNKSLNLIYISLLTSYIISTFRVILHFRVWEKILHERGTIVGLKYIKQSLVMGYPNHSSHMHRCIFSRTWSIMCIHTLKNGHCSSIVPCVSQTVYFASWPRGAVVKCTGLMGCLLCKTFELKIMWLHYGMVLITFDGVFNKDCLCIERDRCDSFGFDVMAYRCSW